MLEQRRLFDEAVAIKLLGPSALASDFPTEDLTPLMTCMMTLT